MGRAIEIAQLPAHLICANIFVGTKHFGSKSLVLTNKLSAEMLRPCTHRDAPTTTHTKSFIFNPYLNSGYIRINITQNQDTAVPFPYN
ncbi:hypothetical protein IQ269_16780 [Tychonema sp. LEGE 07199]|uniref:hypothetical protein n=1 Tax=unclassified Tychonema TaxID=2642144 RepID=UPI0018819F08|nr:MULTISPECIES: hypothetical protein [unclassified Tychonema]MBE9122408.1 hypothetical protein [Tychonema sp. LEGE 07199]MBE9133927.1 hypothetical protein [Tychonema sp. LEGE 07196]